MPISNRVYVKRAISSKGTVAHGVLDKFWLFHKSRQFLARQHLRRVFWRQFREREVLRTLFWASWSFLNKVANFEQKDSCAECFDANFEQKNKCPKGFGQVLAIDVKTLCANVIVLEIGDFC